MFEQKLNSFDELPVRGNHVLKQKMNVNAQM